jgi:hypothetical protein
MLSSAGGDVAHMGGAARVARGAALTLARSPALPGGPLVSGAGCGVSGRVMQKFFDMDDRARLPWRFFGAALSILARL